ncbi:hypothetical protein DUNSADRAFT_13629 [Dunaliella salina]|uniref:Uncharacterized protein n=1 Tax=Dunaliella salina TaxID=3046 RepID=A0ABQ7G8Y8_DUNSA|nr:hypothetical protein DUNSADRAFT_13629 [Dunaliella salina]|eukprot:KAF5831073.1 hypothetical protein DUNSADRAFT_13629 [Dunaliella salina]
MCCIMSRLPQLNLRRNSHPEVSSATPCMRFEHTTILLRKGFHLGAQNVCAWPRYFDMLKQQKLFQLDLPDCLPLTRLEGRKGYKEKGASIWRLQSK